MPSTSKYEPQLELLGLLRKSPIHGVKPIKAEDVDIELIDADKTNPGANEYSRRYERRWPSITESFEIIGGPVYPLVLCQHPDRPGRYMIVDGHGRFDEARRRRKEFKTIRALIFPKLTLEQRICLRETLNAAQEPFDTPLILKDLQLLANERKLDVRNERDLQVLLSDLPFSIRKHEDKLKLLARWPSDVADKIGVDDNDEAGVIGFDKVKELDSLVNTVKRGHPNLDTSYPGDQLYRQVLRMYFDGAFRDGRRSQDTIRDARKIIKKLPQDDTLVKKFLKGGMTFSEFATQAGPSIQESENHKDLTGLCKELNSMLTDIDAHNFTAAERRALKRTADLASQVLEEVGA